MFRKTFLLAYAASIALASCTAPTITNTAKAEVAASALPITQMIGSWSLVELKGQMLGANIAPPSLYIDGARVHGSSGCNNYFGALSGDMASLSFGQMGATKMACLDNARLVDEQSYFNVLGAVKSARINGHEMSLFDSSGTKIAVFVRTPD